MKLLPHWVLNDTHPAFYDSESKTAVEQTARVYGAMQSLITEYNGFVDQVNQVWEEFKDKNLEDNELFQRKMEQLFNDFVKTITLKYQSQDLVLQNAVQEIIANIPVYLSHSLDVMYKNGEFDEIVYQSIGNLKRDFDAIATNTNNFQATMTDSFNNLVNDIELFKQNAETDFTNLENDLNAKFENLVFESDIADMQKSVYDTDDNGIVDNAERLGGELPEYYAKKHDLTATNNNVSSLNSSVNSMNSQMSTIQQAAFNANKKSDNAQTAADNAQTAADNAQTAADNAQTAADNAQTAADNAQTAADNAQTTADNKRNISLYANSADVSINDLDTEGTWRIYILENSDDYNYLGWFGQTLVETFVCGNQIHQRITNNNTGETFFRYNSSGVNLTYDLTLNSLNPVMPFISSYPAANKTFTADSSGTIAKIVPCDTSWYNNGFSINTDGGMVCPSAGYVEVSGQIFINSAPINAYLGVQIIKNTSNWGDAFYYLVGSTTGCLVISPIIIPVSAGDVIYLRLSASTDANANVVVRGSTRTHLLAKYIKR